MMTKDFVYIRNSQRKFVLSIPFEEGLKVDYVSIWWSSLSDTVEVVEFEGFASFDLSSEVTNEFDGDVLYQVYRENPRVVVTHGKLIRKDS